MGVDMVAHQDTYIDGQLEDRLRARSTVHRHPATSTVQELDRATVIANKAQPPGRDSRNSQREVASQPVTSLSQQTLRQQRYYAAEKSLVDQFGLIMFDTLGTVSAAARHLGLSPVGEDALGELLVEERCVQLLDGEPRPAVLAARLGMTESVRSTLELYCVRHVAAARVVNGRSCRKVAEALGLSAYTLKQLQKRVALTQGIDRLLAAAPAAPALADLGLGPGWEHALRTAAVAPRNG